LIFTHFINNNKFIFGIRLFVVIPVVSLFVSCQMRESKGGQLTVTPYIDSMRNKAITIAETDEYKGIRFLDSVIRNYESATILDKYEYYYFCHDRYNRLGDKQKAQNYIDSMFVLIEESGRQDQLTSEYAKVNFSRADQLFEEGNYNNAYEYYYRAKAIAESGSDSCTLGYYNYKIGFVLYRGEKYREAIPFFIAAANKLLACKDELPYFLRTQEILDNIGLSYYHLNKNDSAIYYYEKALDFIKKGRKIFPEDRERFFEAANAVIYGNIATVYMEMGRYNEAENLFKQNIVTNTTKGLENIDAQFSRIKLVDLYLRQNKVTEAERLLNEVSRIHDTLYNVQVELRIKNITWQYWNKKNNAQLAFRYLQQYNLMKDSLEALKPRLLDLNIREHVADLENKNRIILLEKQDDLRKIYIVILLQVTFMAIVIVALIFQNWRKSRENIKNLTKFNAQIVEQKQKLEKVLAELEKSAKEKDRILRAVSHDVRTPVSSIMGLTDLLVADSDKLNEEQKNYLELIKSSCNNALNLTKELLEIATLSTDQITRQWADVNKLISDNIDLLRFRAAKKKQLIVLNLPEQPVKVYINPERIIRVLNNIITNAIKFSPSGKEIFVTLEEKENGVYVSVKDQGIGIPESIKDKIFDIFTEAKRPGTMGEEPFGLGLSIAQQIVEAHGGKVWFESDENGTTFYVFLPKA
jgi:signal transduction histidine kinase